MKVSQRPTLLACLFALPLLGVILAHAGLIPASRWQGDEYFDLAVFRDAGAWHYFTSRAARWSPRPVSEALLTGYFWIVLRIERPLVTSFMALLWSCLLLASGAGLRRRITAGRVIVALALPACFLLSDQVAEVFFWPQGGAAYLLTLAGLTWLFWEIADGASLTSAGPSIALALAAGSSELGAVFTFVFLGLLCATLLRRPAGLKSYPLMLLPAGLAAWDIALVALHRAGAAEAPVQGGVFLHHWGASLMETFPLLWRDIARADGLSVMGLPGIALVTGGVAACWAPALVRAAPLAGKLATFAASLAVTAYWTLAAGLYQFDSPCCSRHETMRQCFVWLAAGAGGVALSPLIARRPSIWRVLAPAPLALLALLALAQRLPALRLAYAQLPGDVAARAANWSALRSPKSGMVFQLPPETPLIPGFGFRPGRSSASDKNPWYIKGIHRFFHKTDVDIRPGRPV